MRLVDIDDFAASNETGKTAVLKILEKWEKEHPLTEIKIPYDSDWEIHMRRKTDNGSAESTERA